MKRSSLQLLLEGIDKNVYFWRIIDGPNGFEARAEVTLNFARVTVEYPDTILPVGARGREPLRGYAKPLMVLSKGKATTEWQVKMLRAVIRSSEELAIQD